MGTLKNKVVYKLGSVFMAVLFIFTAIFQSVGFTKASAFVNSDYYDEYGTFLSALGESESGNKYDALSYDGQFLGRWQIGILGLQEVGFMDSSKNWTSLAASFGITSKETFLASESGQDYAVLAYHKKILRYAENMGITSYINTDVNGVVMTFSGMIASAHALGVGGLQSLIKNGTTGDACNDSLGLKYMKLCSGYNIESTIRNGTLSTGTPQITTTTTSMTTITTTTTTTVATTTTTTVATTTSTETTTSTTTTTTTTAASSDKTTTVTTTVSGDTSQSTELKPPSYIIVTPSEVIATVGDWIQIILESDNAIEYYILITSQSGATSDYKITGSSLSLRLKEDGIYTINVTGYNKAGESYADPVYVAANKKSVVSEEKIGDVNDDGKVDISDSTLILKYYANSLAGLQMDTSETFIRNYADVNDDRSIDISDATFVLKYYAMNIAGMDVKWKDVLAS